MLVVILQLCAYMVVEFRFLPLHLTLTLSGICQIDCSSNTFIQMNIYVSLLPVSKGVI